MINQLPIRKPKNTDEYREGKYVLFVLCLSSWYWN